MKREDGEKRKISKDISGVRAAVSVIFYFEQYRAILGVRDQGQIEAVDNFVGLDLTDHIEYVVIDVGHYLQVIDAKFFFPGPIPEDFAWRQVAKRHGSVPFMRLVDLILSRMGIRLGPAAKVSQD